jgi:peptidoglycan/xylan/chitin deacetylase (PgdA/CDA1 family)
MRSPAIRRTARFLLRFLFIVAYFSGVARLFAWWNRNKVMILCYHGVSPQPEDDGQTVHQDNFSAQLAYLARHYRVISLEAYAQCRKEKIPVPERSVILTFDDGYRNFWSAALPILDRYHFPATLFVVTNHLEDGAEADLAMEWKPKDDHGYVTWRQIEAAEGRHQMQIGSHSVSHPMLSHCSPEQVEQEIQESRKILGARLKRAPIAFAYPFGDYGGRARDYLRTAAYGCAVTTDDGFNGSNTDSYLLRRMGIANVSLPIFAAQISGLGPLSRKVASLWEVFS